MSKANKASDQNTFLQDSETIKAELKKNKALLDETFPERFIDRELSLLAFQNRVLAQAEHKNIPILERLRFLSIVSSNLDEFFEVRVAGLKEQISAGATNISGVPIKKYQQEICEQVHEINDKKYHLFNELLPDLQKEGIFFKEKTDCNDVELIYLETIFVNEILPLLTPIALDMAHPFPHVPNKGMNFIVKLDGSDAFGRPIDTAIVPIPRNLPRIYQIPKKLCGVDYGFIMLSSIITAFMPRIFEGLKVLSVGQFRITRNSHVFVDEEEAKNLRIALQGELEQRNRGKAVRLEVTADCPAELIALLLHQYELEEFDLYKIEGIINLVRLMGLPNMVERPDLKFPSFVPRYPENWDKSDNFFRLIRKGDILLNHPFESFNPINELLLAAAKDPKVQAIRMTVYRTGLESNLMSSLVRAAKNGKEVNVVVELFARFDEATNISWAKQLEQAGVKIVYGVFGLKTHAKMLLIVRKEKSKTGLEILRHYSHVGSGNYHPTTAKLYTDFGLLTANQEIGYDLSNIFLNLSSLTKTKELTHIWQAPFMMFNHIKAAIDQEIAHAKAGKPAKIIAKMNSLLEPGVIDSLYLASQAGVKIELIVRGACALRPKVKGLSDNIRVYSVIGRFLEHSRIFYFYNSGKENVYLSSADWMNRNLFRRIEIATPILVPKLKRRIVAEGLRSYLKADIGAYELDGNTMKYRPRRAKNKPYSPQIALLEEYCAPHSKKNN